MKQKVVVLKRLRGLLKGSFFYVFELVKIFLLSYRNNPDRKYLTDAEYDEMIAKIKENL